MTDDFEDHEGTVSIKGRAIPVSALLIASLAGEEELAKLVKHFKKASAAYGMEVSVEKTKLMTNNTNSINIEIKINGQKLETVEASSTCVQLCLMKAPCVRYSPG